MIRVSVGADSIITLEFPEKDIGVLYGPLDKISQILGTAEFAFGVHQRIKVIREVRSHITLCLTVEIAPNKSTSRHSFD